MHDRTLIRTAAAALAGAMLLSACGVIPFPGMPVDQGGGVPGAVDPAVPGKEPGGVGGGTGGDTGSGSGTGGGGIGGGPVAPGNPTIVVVQPGQANLREVNAVELASRIAPDGHVIVRVRWWGGIEPCETLDSVLVDRAGDTFTITARVGSPRGNQIACIEIARDTATFVDLGALPSGSYSVRVHAGTAPAITVVVP